MCKLGKVYNLLKRESERIVSEMAVQFDNAPTQVPTTSVVAHSFFFYMYDYKFLLQVEMYSDCETSKEGFLTFYRSDKEGWVPMQVVRNDFAFRFFIKDEGFAYETGLEGIRSITENFDWWKKHLHESFVNSFANQRLPLDLSMIKPIAM